MPKLKVKKPFKWAHRHVDVKEYAPGDVIDTDDADLIRVATEEGWASAGRGPAKPDAGDAPDAPAGPDATQTAAQDEAGAAPQA